MERKQNGNGTVSERNRTGTVIGTWKIIRTGNFILTGTFIRTGTAIRTGTVFGTGTVIGTGTVTRTVTVIRTGTVKITGRVIRTGTETERKLNVNGIKRERNSTGTELGTVQERKKYSYIIRINFKFHGYLNNLKVGIS